MIQHPEFVHLHNHTEYSLLDGACRIVDDKDNPSELLKYIANHKMKSLAITDHGTMFGVVEFYRACLKIGIKPIIGCEMYLAPDSRFIKRSTPDTVVYNHLTLLAKDETGYKNLLKLSSLAYLEGFYYHPRIDKELLTQYSQGLIILSGCMKGEIPLFIVTNKFDEARESANFYRDLVGKDNFYFELMDNGIPAQKTINAKLIELGKELSIPVVATNDCHYLHKNDAEAHEVLLCIGTQTNINNPKRLRFSTQEFYYKSSDEMHQLFSSYPEALRNTLEIAEKCQLEILFNQFQLPHYHLPENETSDQYLEKLCRKGLKSRYPDMSDKDYLNKIEQRLVHELVMIKKMGFAGYFLIVWDFVEEAKRQNIPVGPGRGSGAGSLVAYLLGITDIDPLKYGLIFERFLNPERHTLPDLDIDFSDHGRENVIKYVREKYGENNVAQIITFGTMQAKSVVRDVGRVLGVPLSTVDRIAKLIPQGASIYNALQSVTELKEESKNPEIKKLIEIAQKLEGLKRHTGVHAAGIVIAKDDITNFVPLAKQQGKDVITTQYEDKILLKLGMLKMDFLGLRTLTVIQDTLSLIKENQKKEIDLKMISLKDKKTYKLLSEGRTGGVFQLESFGMRELLRKFKPNEFEDIIALNALYRPGPIGSGVLDDFVARKHQKTKVKYDHPLLEPILKETYGIILYQEQAMRIATDLAKFTPAQADFLRQAMAKKQDEEMKKQEKNFIEGAKSNNIDKRIAQKICDSISYFAGYGFNKSHATAYALIAYHTAYLKANFPLEYITALLNSEIGRSTISEDNKNKIAEYISEAREWGINLLPPDIQRSEEYFSIENGNIRYGLVSIKNVGSGAAESISNERKNKGKYKSWEDFIMRIDSRQVNKKVMESLVKSGACDCFHKYRAELFNQLNEDLFRLNRSKNDNQQETLFADFVSLKPKEESPVPVQEWHEHILLAYEKEVLGLYISGHPLARVAKELKLYSNVNLTQLQRNNEKENNEVAEQETSVKIHGGNNFVRCAGMIVNIRRMISKEKKEQYARFKMENLDGEIDVVVFPRSYASGLAKHITENSMVVVKGRLNKRSDNGWELFAEEIIPFAQARERFIRRIWIELDTSVLEDEFLDNLKKTLKDYPGKCKTGIIAKSGNKEKGVIKIDTGINIEPKDTLFHKLEKIVGKENILLDTDN